MTRDKERIEAKIQYDSVEKINSQFSKVKILVMYAGLNRNNSFISKETVDNALNSIFNIPVVGEFLEEVDDDGNFGSHGGKIEISDKGIKFIKTTRPFGVVHESANPRWELIEDTRTGVPTEYLVVDAYLWTEQYPELEIVMNKGSWQSMEISPKDAEWALMQDEDGLFRDVYKISDFEFNALCILGKSDDPNVNVEPCFEDAQVIAYQFNKDEFRKQYEEMLHQLKFALSSENDGGIEMNYENDNLSTDEVIDEVTDVVTDEVTDEVTEDVTETVEDTTEEFETEQIEETEQVEETETTESEEEEEEVEKTYSETEYNALLGRIAELENTITELEEFKSSKESEEKQEQIDALFAKFSKMLSDEEMKELKENALELDITILENSLYALVGKKKANFTKTESTKQMMSVENVNVDEEDKKTNPYGELERFFNKN